MYTTSSTLIIIAIIVLAIALIAAIIAYQNLKNNGVISNMSSGDISYTKNVLIFFIVVDSIMLLASFYALAKVRSSNIGGWLGFIIGLIIVIAVLIVGIMAINKVDPVAYPWVLRGLTINVVFIILSFFLLILSVFTKPKLCTGNSIKKIFGNMKRNAEDCMPCPPPVNPCPPPVNPCAPRINPCPPQQVNLCPPPQTNICPPVQPMNNCAVPQINSYVQNPYLPVK